MKNLIKTLLILAIITILGCGIYYYLTEDYWKFDRFYTRNIDQFEEVNSFLKNDDTEKLKKECLNYPKVMHHSNSDEVDFTVSNDNLEFLKINYPKIHSFLKAGLSEKIICLKSGSILFNLKWCDRPNCIKENGGFFGFYVHYLSKDKIDFENTDYTQLKDKKTFDDWTYYIVWYKKG